MPEVLSVNSAWKTTLLPKTASPEIWRAAMILPPRVTLLSMTRSISPLIQA
jgi:hypothetical protein